VVRDALGSDVDIPPDVTLLDLGLGSRDQLKLVSDLEAEFAVDLPLELLTGNLTIAELHRALRESWSDTPGGGP
jgi:acyl carrier protein